MKRIALIILVLVGFSSAAQTKKIAHRSHSGRDAGFTISGIDNFGETPEMRERWRKEYEEQQKEDEKEKQRIKEDSARRADSVAKQEKYDKKYNKRHTKDSLKKDKELKEKGNYNNPKNMDKQNALALSLPADGGSGFPPAGMAVVIALASFILAILFAVKHALQKRLHAGV